jgi:hypothetical protein
MKYYKIAIRGYYEEYNRIANDAEGEEIFNADYYFKRIRDGEFVTNAPVFDYFYLKSFDKKEYWEWKLCDVHSFIGEASHLSTCWFISRKLKLLLEKFKLSKPCHYYDSKLLYDGKKLDYYIFQFTGNLIYEQILEYIEYSKSIFWNPTRKIEVKVNNTDSFLTEYDKIGDENRGVGNIIQNRKLVLKEPLDFFSMSSLTMGNIVSERLKTAMEEAGIEGFEFSELDYDVIVEK